MEYHVPDEWSEKHRWIAYLSSASFPLFWMLLASTYQLFSQISCFYLFYLVLALHSISEAREQR
jgi:hypothetical protein